MWKDVNSENSWLESTGIQYLEWSYPPKIWAWHFSFPTTVKFNQFLRKVCQFWEYSEKVSSWDLEIPFGIQDKIRDRCEKLVTLLDLPTWVVTSKEEKQIPREPSNLLTRTELMSRNIPWLNPQVWTTIQQNNRDWFQKIRPNDLSSPLWLKSEYQEVFLAEASRRYRQSTAIIAKGKSSIKNLF